MAGLETDSPCREGRSAVRKISRRILPYVFVLYIIAYLDRANIAFAKTTMSAALGFSEAVFGLGAGIFFVGYLLLEIPSTIIVEKWSARKWISRILISWGLCTVLVGFVRTPGQFYAARFALGVAEAGFFPGIIVYLTHWFPREDRAKAMSGLILGAPVSLAIGAPISALILRCTWLGLDGWQWMFILQGLPAVLFGLLTPWYLRDRPGDAPWLDADEREWLQSKLAAELDEKRRHGKQSIGAAFARPEVWILAFTLLLANIGGYAFVLWLPATLQGVTGSSASGAAALSVVPFSISAASMWLIARSADRTRAWRLHTSAALFATAAFFFLAGSGGRQGWMPAAWLCATAAFVYAWAPPFWVLPTLSLGEMAGATSIGFINSIGNLGGFAGPSLVGYLLTSGAPPMLSTALLCGCFLTAGLLALFLKPGVIPGLRR
jgi:MFS transporter, ACS family, tartrate transporter